MSQGSASDAGLELDGALEVVPVSFFFLLPFIFMRLAEMWNLRWLLDCYAETLPMESFGFLLELGHNGKVEQEGVPRRSLTGFCRI